MSFRIIILLAALLLAALLWRLTERVRHQHHRVSSVLISVPLVLCCGFIWLAHPAERTAEVLVGVAVTFGAMIIADWVADGVRDWRASREN